MSSVSPGKLTAAARALSRARTDISTVVASAEFGFMALIMLFVRFTWPNDWDEWAEGKDAITDWLLEQLPHELGPGVDTTMRTLRSLPPALHADLIGAIDLAVRQLGYAAAFQLILADFTADLDVFTPASVAEILADITDAGSATSVYDPFCRAGELLVATGTRPGSQSAAATVSAWGEVPDLKSQAIARINLRLHGIDGGVGLIPDVLVTGLPKASVIVTNPPFNVKGWLAFRDHEWRYGKPPAKNANFAWLQYVLERLEPGGTAAVVMANSAAFSAHEREQQIRANMVADACVQALIALPPSLFHGTGVSATIWLLKAPAAGDSRKDHDITFVDATKAGLMTSRTLRELTDPEIQAIVTAVTGRATELPPDGTVRCVSASIAEIQQRGFNLSPAAYLPGDSGGAPASATELIGRWESALISARRSDELAANTATSLADRQSLITATSSSWRQVRLAEVCDLIPGTPTKDVPPAPGTVPVLKPKNLVAGLLSGETDMVDAREAGRNPRYLIESGDLLIARTGTMGKVGLVTAEQQGWVFGSGLIRIRIKSDHEPDLNPRFLAAYFMSPVATDWVIRNSGGTSIPSISAKVLGTLPVTLPPPNVQRAIADVIDRFAANAAAHEQARQAATELNSALLLTFFSNSVLG